MKSEVLEMHGERYITSARAAELVGYTKDYVGQLARAGKLNAKLVGRGWYVSEDSIRKHQLSVHYTLTKPKKSQKQAIVSEAKKTNKSKDISGHKDSAIESGVSRGKYAEREMMMSNIRYEKGELLRYDDDSQVPRLKKNIHHTKGVTNARQQDELQKINAVKRENIPLRHTRHLKPSHTSAHTLTKKDSIHDTARVDAYKKPVLQHTTKPIKKYAPKNKKRVRSKLFPVSVALVSFVIFFLWYMFTVVL